MLGTCSNKTTADDDTTVSLRLMTCSLSPSFTVTGHWKKASGDDRYFTRNLELRYQFTSMRCALVSTDLKMRQCHLRALVHIRTTSLVSSLQTHENPTTHIRVGIRLPYAGKVKGQGTWNYSWIGVSAQQLERVLGLTGNLASKTRTETLEIA